MKYLNLLSTVIITKGKYRSCLIDTESKHYCVIPSPLTDFFNENYFIKISNVYDSLDSDSKIIFKDYISFLINNGFAIISNKVIKFRKHNLEKYETPHQISNIIFDIDDYFSYKERLSSINSSSIGSMQIRIFIKSTTLFIEKLLTFIISKGFNNIELIINHNDSLNPKIYKEFYLKYKVLARIIVMNYNANINILNGKVFGVKTKLKNIQQCGIISKSLFCTNINSIQLSNSHNSCLYKKISIDAKGEIKNCPSMPQSFGNINDTNLDDIIKDLEFKKYWNITKDEIDICKDCEFRYICTDCRAYTERNNISKEALDLSKPLKCGYDPYTGKWEEWSTNPLKQKAIKYYEMQELVKPDDKEIS